MPAESEASAVMELGLGFHGGAHVSARGQRGSEESRESGTPELRQQAAVPEVAGDGRTRAKQRRWRHRQEGIESKGRERERGGSVD